MIWKQAIISEIVLVYIYEPECFISETAKWIYIKYDIAGCALELPIEFNFGSHR
jgi:hypothetical protein